MKKKNKNIKKQQQGDIIHICMYTTFLFILLVYYDWQDKPFKLYFDLQPCRVKEITIITLAQRIRKRKRINEQHTYFESSL